MPQTEPLVLAVETALQKWSVSILRSSGEIFTRRDESGIASSAALLPNIESLLQENSVSLSEIDVLAVSSGPGSLTGLRVGMATVEALATALKRPCLGVSTLEALALAAEDVENIFAVAAAGKGQIYWQHFSGFRANSERQGKPCVENVENFAENLRLFRETAASVVTIIAEEKILSQLRDSLNRFDSSNRQINFKVASDNVSKYVGLRGGALFKTVRIQDLARENLSPQYLHAIKIGGRMING